MTIALTPFPEIERLISNPGMSRPKKSETPGPIYVEIGKRIAKARGDIGLSQDALGKRVGLQRTSITNIERGRQRFMIDSLYALAEALEVSILDLLPANAPSAMSLEATLESVADDRSRDFIRRVMQLQQNNL